MKYYVFFSLAAIASVALAGFAFQMYRGTVAAPAPVLIAEVSRAVVPRVTSKIATSKIAPTSKSRGPDQSVGATSPVIPAEAGIQEETKPPADSTGSPQAEVRPPAVEESPADQSSGDPTSPTLETPQSSEVGSPIVEEPAPQPAPEPVPLPSQPEPPPSVRVRVLISEILYDAAGSDVGKEFIELYNSGEAEVDLDGWSLSNGEKTLIKIGSAENDRIKTHARGFFLIGFNKYVGSSDAVRSAALPNTSATIVLKDKEGATVDEVSYGGDLAVEKNLGASLERRAWEGVALFSVQLNPNPQPSY